MERYTTEGKRADGQRRRERFLISGRQQQPCRSTPYGMQAEEKRVSDAALRRQEPAWQESDRGEVVGSSGARPLS